MLYDDKKFIGKVIKNARKKANLTQSELSEKVNMCEKNLCNIENGKQFPQVNNFLRIIEVLDISLEEFGIIKISSMNEIKKELLKIIISASDNENCNYLKIIEIIKSLKNN